MLAKPAHGISPWANRQVIGMKENDTDVSLKRDPSRRSRSAKVATGCRHATRPGC